MSSIGMRVYAINRRGRTDERVDWIGSPERLNKLLEAADVLLLSAPLTRATYGLIGAAELRRLHRCLVDRAGTPRRVPHRSTVFPTCRTSSPHRTTRHSAL